MGYRLAERYLRQRNGTANAQEIASLRAELVTVRMFERDGEYSVGIRGVPGSYFTTCIVDAVQTARAMVAVGREAKCSGVC